jgi:hypothetical protein
LNRSAEWREWPQAGEKKNNADRRPRGALLAGIVVVIALNFTSGEKRIQRELEHRYAIDDPQFLRELGTLLGPPIVSGNRVVNFENGSEIFPAMLAAIQAQRSPSTLKPTSIGQATSDVPLWTRSASGRRRALRSTS